MSKLCRNCGEAVAKGSICEDCLFIFGPGSMPEMSQREGYSSYLTCESESMCDSISHAFHQRPEQLDFREKIAEEE